MSVVYANSRFNEIVRLLEEAASAQRRIQQAQVPTPGPAARRRQTRSTKNTKQTAQEIQQKYEDTIDELNHELGELVVSSQQFTDGPAVYDLMNIKQAGAFRKLYSYLSELDKKLEEGGEAALDDASREEVRRLVLDFVKTVDPKHPVFEEGEQEAVEDQAHRRSARIAKLSEVVEEDGADETLFMDQDAEDGGEESEIGADV